MLEIKIAWRSLLRHKGKSIIIGTILFLGAFIMTLGDSTAIGMKRGVEENIVKSFTGHIVIVSDQEQKDNVLFTPMMKPLKVLKDFNKIKDVLGRQDYIKDFIPMTRGGVMILGGQQMDFLATFGCNFEDFQRVFGDPIRPIEGSLLKNGDHGLLVNKRGRENRFKQQGYWLVPEGTEADGNNLTPEAKKEGKMLVTKQSLPLEGFGEVNSTSREVPIRGIIRFRSLNAMMEDLTIMDIETFRELFGYYTAREVVEELPPEQNRLMAATEDDLFEGGDIFSTGSTSSSVKELENKIKAAPKVTRKIDYDSAAFNYISVLLKPGQDLKASIAKLKEIAKENNLPVKVLSWKTASGQVAQMSDILEIIIIVFVIMLFIVAIIIIMNTLSMNALERTEEFGMMRAVGARKGFITKMFLSETFTLSAVFGGIGIFFGVIATWIIRPMNISSGGNEILEMLFGGEIFRPSLGFGGLVIGVIGLVIVTVLAIIYPVLVARKITPLDAINRH